MFILPPRKGHIIAREGEGTTGTNRQKHRETSLFQHLELRTKPEFGPKSLRLLLSKLEKIHINGIRQFFLIIILRIH